jgi:hypothetical protein
MSGRQFDNVPVAVAAAAGCADGLVPQQSGGVFEIALLIVPTVEGLFCRSRIIFTKVGRMIMVSIKDLLKYQRCS